MISLVASSFTHTFHRSPPRSSSTETGCEGLSWQNYKGWQ